MEHSLLEQLTSLWERLCKEVESEIQEGVKQQLGFNATPTFTATTSIMMPLPAASAPDLSPAASREEQPRLAAIRTATPVIVMQRNDRVTYPNTRGKRKMEETIKVHRSKRRHVITADESSTTTFDDALLLEDEVVPTSLRQPMTSQQVTTIQLLKSVDILDSHSIH